MLELYDILLYLPACLCKHQIVMSIVSGEAKAAVELLVDLAAVFDFVIFVFLTEELTWVVGKVR